MHILRTRLVAATATAALTLATAAAVSAPAEAKPKPPAKTVSVNLIGFNDFHGAIDKPTGSQGNVNGTPAGGVEYLATAVKNLRAQQKQESPHSFTVGAGDLVGATPLVSAAFHDEPVVDEMNALGLDVTSVGNHEFDEGVNELLRLQRGGCHPTDGCQDGDGFRGAKYPMLAANVVYKKSRKPILKPYTIKNVGGVKVGFVGMTLEGTPSIVNPAGITNVDFLDESQTANRYAQELRPQGRALPRAAPPRGRLPAGPGRRPQRLQRLQRAGGPTSCRGSPPSTARWSAATPTPGTPADCRTRSVTRCWSPARARTAGSSPTSV